MFRIPQLIDRLKSEWAFPREVIHRGENCPFPLTCRFSSNGFSDFGQLPLTIPDDLKDFWVTNESANLFKDETYGQWGLEILEPNSALAETSTQLSSRPEDFTPTDLVFGKFFGDSDLAVISCDSESINFGSVLIATPLDYRENWLLAARTFNEFLSMLIDSQGDKYWEVNK